MRVRRSEDGRPQEALGPQVGRVREGALGLGAGLRGRQGHAEAVGQRLRGGAGLRGGRGGGVVAHAWPPSWPYGCSCGCGDSNADGLTPPAPGPAWCGIRASAAVRGPRVRGRVGLSLGDDLAYGVQDAAVAGAAAQVAAQGLARLQLGRRRVALQEVVHGHRHARDAESALHGAALGERPLDVGGLPVGGEALDGAHLAAGGGHGGHQAGRHEPAVHLHVAGPALALRAAVLGAREAEPLAQYVEQRFADPGVRHGPFDAVHPQDVRGQGVVVVRGRTRRVVGRGPLGGVGRRLGGLLRRVRPGLGGRFVGPFRGAVSRPVPHPAPRASCLRASILRGPRRRRFHRRALRRRR